MMGVNSNPGELIFGAKLAPIGSLLVQGSYTEPVKGHSRRFMR